MRFFTFSDKLANAAFRGTVGGEFFSDFCAAHRGKALEQNLVVGHLSGSILRDFIWTGAVVPLISERVVHLFRDHEITGWATYGVEVFDAKNQRISGYHGFAVTGRCASIDFDIREEALIYKPNPAGRMFPHFKGLKFDVDTWDGSDFFMGADAKTGWTVVTERVHKLFRMEKVTNCAFEPVEEVELLATESAIQRSKANSPE